jgi:DNA-binding transcriptional MocR family regulator
MTIWRPEFPQSDKPLYLAIADLIGLAISKGELRPDDRLPTHRELARHLGVTVGTVTKGYEEAQRRGIVVARVGSGTFVNRRHVPPLGAPYIAGEAVAEALSRTLSGLAKMPNLMSLLSEQGPQGNPRFREAAAIWIRRCGLNTSPDEVLVAAGAQHGLNAVFSSLLGPGGTLFTESLSYPGARTLGHSLDLRVIGLAIDGQGLVPEALEEACQRHRPALLYCVPTHHFPTGALMGLKRREQIAEIVERYELVLLEDDSSTPLMMDPLPPISSLIPQRSVYLADPTFALCPSLRSVYLRVPPPILERVYGGIRATLVTIPPLDAEVISSWITSGVAERLLQEAREEKRYRHDLTQEILGTLDVVSHSAAPGAWLTLPERWRAVEFARAAPPGVQPAEAYAVGGEAIPQAVFLPIGRAPGRDALRQSLVQIRDLVTSSPPPHLAAL